MAQQVVKAEIGGVVARIERRQGDAVVDGETLIVLESMKMEIPVSAPAGGTLARVLVAEGDVVTEGESLAIIETS
jgi:biotin carboxyl carrier protein